MGTLVLTVVLAYLLGSIPFGYLLVRIFRGEDVRQSGSGNIGATNVSRRFPGLGALTLLFDALKGSLAVMLGVALSLPIFLCMSIFYILWCQISSIPPLAVSGATAALSGILGHMF